MDRGLTPAANTNVAAARLEDEHTAATHKKTASKWTPFNEKPNISSARPKVTFRTLSELYRDAPAVMVAPLLEALVTPPCVFSHADSGPCC